MSNDKSESKSKIWQLELANKNMELEISARKEIERVLKYREDRFKIIFNHAPVAYFLCDLKGNFVDGNHEAFNLTGYSKQELFGKNFINTNLIEKQEQQAVMELILRSGKGEYTGPDEFFITKKDGNIAIIELSTSPVTIQGRRQILGVAYDITDRKLINIKLQESEERFRKLFDSAHDALMTLNPPTWKFTSGNPAILEMFKVKNIEEFLTYGPWDISPEKQPDGRLSSEKAKEMIEKAMTNGSNFFEWTHKRISGEPFPATVLLTKIILKDETFLQATVRDITERKLAEDTLKKSESLLKSILDSTGDGLLVVDANGRITHRNDEFIKMWNIPSKLNNDTDDSKLIDFVLNQLSEPSQFLSKVKELYKSTKTSNDILYFKDGRIFERHSYPLMEKNTISGRVWSFTDITMGKQAELKLKQSEERFKRLFDDLGDAVYVTKLRGIDKGKILEVNRAAERQTGYTRNELLKMNIIKDLYISGSGESKAKNWEEELGGGKIIETTEKKRKKNGEEFWTDVIVTSIDYKGEKAGLSINHDITNRKQAERALLESEEKYRSLFEKSKDAILIINNGKFVDCNQATIEMLGYKNKDKFLNTHPSKLSPEKQPDGKMSFTKANKMMDIALKNGSHRFEWDHKKSNGDIFPVEVLLTTISTDEKEKILHTVWRDITDRKRTDEEIRQKSKELEKQFQISEKQRVTTLSALADLSKTTKELQFEIEERKKSEKALTENEEKYHSLTENIPLGIYRNTPGAKGKFIEVNQALVDMFGFKDREAMLAVTASSLYVSPSTRKKFSDKLAKQGFVKNEELRLLRQDGSSFVGSSTAIAVKDENGKTIHYDGIIEDVTERWELRNQILESEEKFRSIVNNSPDIILQIDLHGVITYINYEYSNQKPEDIVGKSIYELMPLEFQEIARSTIKKVFKTGESYSFENLGININDTVLWYRNNVAPMSKNGKVVAATIIATDISEQKQIEILKNEFVGSVSHELRTPLTIIRESLSILSEGLFGKLNNDQLNIVNPCLDDVDRLSRIINNLLDISRIEGQKIKLEREMVDIVKLAKGVILSFGNKAATKNIELIFKPSHQSINLYLDKDRLIQVFMNLIGNSMKFTEKGKIEVLITEKGNDVECCIADTGRGIEQKDVGTLFDRFHQVGKVMRAGEKGSGLGLSISKGIIKLHNGRIWVDSKINKGSKFFFTLPKYSTDDIIIENIENDIKKFADKHIKLSLLLVKLNNYSDIESKFGAEKAANVIKLILQTIQDSLAPGEFSFKKENDEILLFSDITRQNIIILFSKLEDMVSDLVLEIDKNLTVDLSHGYSLYPDNGENANQLIQNAYKGLLKNSET